MNTNAITPDTLANSVIAVPPLARDADLKVCATENAKIMRHLEAGGVRTLLYGGNAMFYHIALAEYADTLAILQENAGADTVVIPSVGPAFGTTLDQAAVLRDFDFPTVMVLPARDIATPDGVATGIRKFAEAYGKPIVLYDARSKGANSYLKLAQEILGKNSLDTLRWSGPEPLRQVTS